MQHSSDLQLVPNDPAKAPVPERTDGSAGFEFFGSGGQYFRIWIVNLLPPTGQVIGMLLLWGALPYLLVRSLCFRAANTSYCVIRFGFDGSYGGAVTGLKGAGLASMH